ncbi:hypothetical protein A6J64_019400 [Yersinia enterocolitica]|nr:hypothetical protein A6J63_020620 [Yersinia enterocolitica]PNM13992.1 hypothetical protein A6J64_019400 [Yersinia enterocolitica]
MSCPKIYLFVGKALVNISPSIDTFVQHRTEMGRIMHHNDAVSDCVLLHRFRIQLLPTTLCPLLVVVVPGKR